MHTLSFIFNSGNTKNDINILSGIILFTMLLGTSADSGDDEVPTTDVSFTIYHTGDMHSHFTMEKNETGGMDRIITFIRRARNEQKKSPFIYLDTGDIFTGTKWFKLWGSKVVTDYVRHLPVDAMCIGAHEFDEGIDNLRKYLGATKRPIVCANADFSQERGLRNYVDPSLILNVANAKVGIIGYMDKNVGKLSPVGNIKVRDEATALRREILKLKRKGVNIIIALGNSGYDEDKKLASNVDDIDIIVGGGSHTFLYTGDSPVSHPRPKDNYPSLVKNKNGYDVPVLHAYAYSTFLGRLQVTFDENGVLKSFSGSPILMNSSHGIDSDLHGISSNYRDQYRVDCKQVGRTLVELNGECRFEECNFANLLMDAVVNYRSKMKKGGSYWTDTAIALVNGGAIRHSIGSATSTDARIEIEELFKALPFDNILVMVDIKGSTFLEAIEHGVSAYGSSEGGEFLQFSGVHVVYNFQNEASKRVEDIRIRCARCDVPKYEPLNLNETYKVFINYYIAAGGDGYGMLAENSLLIEPIPITDYKILLDYIKSYKTVQPQSEERIILKIDHGEYDVRSATNCVTYNKILYSTSIIYIHLYYYFVNAQNIHISLKFT